MAAPARGFAARPSDWSPGHDDQAQCAPWLQGYARLARHHLGGAPGAGSVAPRSMSTAHLGTPDEVRFNASQASMHRRPGGGGRTAPPVHLSHPTLLCRTTRHLFGTRCQPVRPSIHAPPPSELPNPHIQGLTHTRSPAARCLQVQANITCALLVALDIHEDGRP
ncbi:hypothetical protein Purlil1_6130 [Purpureocillium lilacinum]|uniref:Uncharacterized protein n=1 Tax=Purpureocillium lilacinum TaxID=33203 RepID=A0ABR0BZN2_PURLI|nr:hypothetical protein Purlil1_6130 [Purpureocillium lilacinum]